MKSLVKTLALTTFAVCVTAYAQQRPELQNPYRFPPPAPPAAMPGALGALTNTGAQAGAQIGGAPLFLTLSGTTANDISGQSIGTVQYAMVGPNGTLDLALLMVNGRLVPVPWQLMSASGDATPGRVALTANVDRQRLLQAPAVSVSQLPQLLQDPALQQIYAFFGLQAPNQTAAQGAVGTQTNALRGGATSTTTTPSGSTGTNAIAFPPATGPAGVSSPAGTPGAPTTPNSERPSISRPPDTGPANQGTPVPRPQPTPGQIQR